MDLEVIRTFIIVAELGSFTEASRALGVAQSTVTARIKALEASVGGALFLRDPAKTVLSESGRTYIRFAERCLRAEAEGKEAVSEMQRQANARSVAMISNLVAATELPGMYQAERAAKEGAPHVRIRVGTSKRVFRSVRDGRADVGVAGGFYSHPDLRTEVLNEEEYTFVAADEGARRNTRVGLREIASRTGALYVYDEDPDDQLRAGGVLARLEPLGLSIVRVGDLRVLQELVSNQTGLGLAPRTAFEAALQQGRLRAVPSLRGLALPKHVTCLLTRRPSAYLPLSQASKQFAGAVRRHFRTRSGMGQP